MDTLSLAKKVMTNLFKVTAKEHKVAIREIKLIFRFKHRDQFWCLYDGKEVKLSSAGPVAMMAAGKINTFICRALTKFGQQGIGLTHVNVLVQIVSEDNFVLFLRNEDTVVKEIKIEDFLNL